MDVKRKMLPKIECKRRRGVDKISELPDSLLHDILSLLPIEQAVTTSILSTRWRYLWTSMPVLNFLYRSKLVISDHNPDLHYKYYPNPTSPTKFINFVDKVLQHHDMNIQKFSLDFEETVIVDESILIGWVWELIRHKVPELTLILHVKQPFVCPPDLLKCESLVKLELEMGNCVLKLPTSPCFPHLKVLHLLSFKFLYYNSTEQLFSNFPVLEELILDKCKWEDMNISGRALKRLTIKEHVEVEDLGLRDCVLKINAPNLVDLTYLCNLPKDFIPCNFPSLTNARIWFATESLGRNFEELGYCARKFLGSLSNIKSLEIWGDSFEIFSNAKDLFSHLPAFNNLTHLLVNVGVYFPYGRALMELFHISPNLESLVLLDDFEVQKECWEYEKVPQCLLLHLKTVKFMHFAGKETEFYALKYFLKNAKVFKMMTVTCCRHSPIICCSHLPTNLEKKLMISKQILMLPRGSTNNVIQFN